MSITVRCTGCRKKISVDDGFAGGVARCPYCKEIVMVAGVKAAGRGDRPESPDARPETPDGAVTEPTPPAEGTPPVEGTPAPAPAPAVAPHEVPMASPVRMQGIFTVALLGALVVMIAGAVWLGISLSNKKKAAPDQEPTNYADLRSDSSRQTKSSPEQRKAAASQAREDAKTKSQAGSIEPGKLASPVLICVESGGSMKELFDYARYMVRIAVRKMSSTQQVDVLVLGEDESKSLEGGWHEGGPAADPAVKALLEVRPRGEVNLAKGMAAALERQPQTILLYSHVALGDANELAVKAKAAGVIINTICVAGDSEAQESLAALAAATGGKAMAYAEPELQAAVEAAAALE